MQRLKQDMNIGTNISRLRVRAGLTQEQTTAKIQVLGCTLSRSTYSQIEYVTYDICISELLAMKEVFNAAFDDFFKELQLSTIEKINEGKYMSQESGINGFLVFLSDCERK